MFNPYKVIPSTYGLKEIPRYQSTNSSALYEYERLLACLQQSANLEVALLRDMLKPIPKSKSRVMIRHDIDHDISAALAMSRLEYESLIFASYYIYHAAGYYGEFVINQAFYRNDALADTYLRIQGNGAEVGLHIDAFTVYKQGMDGAEAIKTELAWLRSLGLKIKGITAHGSAQYCGTENYEIFREFNLSGKELITLYGKKVMLGILSAEAMGIEYEGNFATRKKDVDKKKLAEYLKYPATENLEKHLYWYLFDNPSVKWGQDYTCWVYGRDKWCISGDEFEFGVTMDRVIEFLGNVEAGKRIVLHVHPCYFGWRG